MSQDKSENPKMYQTDAASLCTLCVLETRANVFENFSPSLSSDSTQTFSSFNIPKKLSTFPPSRLHIIENNVAAGINNYLPSHRQSFNKIEETMKLDNNKVIDSTKSQLEKNEKFQWKPTNRPDVHKNESKYPEKSIEQSTILSFSGISRSISLEIGILPELSQTIIDRVLALVDKNLIETTKKIGIACKFDESSKEQPQVSILKTSSQTTGEVTNRQKVVSTVNPFLGPIRRLQRTGPSGMSPKRDKNNGTMELGTEVPKKKPKIVNQEVLQFPVFRFPLCQDPTMQNLKGNINKNDWRVDTKGFPEVTKVLEISTDTGDSEGRTVGMNVAGSERERTTDWIAEGPRKEMQKVEKERNAEEKPERANNKGAFERDSPVLTKRFPPKYSDLLMLQRKITENSQSLINQAEEMKRLSGFIDELKESLTSEETASEDAASRREQARLIKKEFVSKSTQTTDSPRNWLPSKISPDDPTSHPFPPFVNNVQESNVESSQTNNNSRPIEQSETDHRDCFPPVTLKPNKDSTEQSLVGAQETAPKPPCQKDFPEKIAVEKSMDEKLLSVVANPEISNSAVQYDPYYNPLRPRRWPRNRNNPTKFGLGKQCHSKNSYFPPLPIVIENRRSTNSKK